LYNAPTALYSPLSVAEATCEADTQHRGISHLYDKTKRICAGITGLQQVCFFCSISLFP